MGPAIANNNIENARSDVIAAGEAHNNGQQVYLDTAREIGGPCMAAVRDYASEVPSFIAPTSKRMINMLNQRQDNVCFEPSSTTQEKLEIVNAARNAHESYLSAKNAFIEARERLSGKVRNRVNTPVVVSMFGGLLGYFTPRLFGIRLYRTSINKNMT